MYFTNANLRDFITNDLVIDITDVVTQTTDDKFSKVYNDTKTIEQKMVESIRDYDRGYDPNYYTTNGATYKYYGVPVFVSTASLIYDVDLWEEQEFYFTQDYYEGNPSAYPWTSGLEGADPKSVGQDGIEGTLDDGLPCTYADFKLLLGEINGASCYPLTVSGANTVYSREYFVQLTLTTKVTKNSNSI